MPQVRQRQANSGSFKPGQSGNPGGMRRDVGHIREMARAAAPQAIEALIRALTDKNVRCQIAAASELLDRGFGRPPQFIEVDAGDELVRRMNEAATRLYATSPSPTARLQNGAEYNHDADNSRDV